jgi:hypothetical protein
LLGRTLPALVPLFALALTACHRERTARHEELASALAAPATLLCGDNKEGGGCYADCQTWTSAERGRAVVEASASLAAVPAFADPDTEPLLERLRQAARSAHEVLAEACPAPISRDAALTPEVRRCAQALRDANVSPLYAAFERLASDAEARTGVALPRPGRPCPAPR